MLLLAGSRRSAVVGSWVSIVDGKRGLWSVLLAITVGHLLLLLVRSLAGGLTLLLLICCVCV